MTKQQYQMRDDLYNDYAIVIESATEPSKVEILKDELNFLRFRTCLQTFNVRNRNRRLWLSKWAKPMIAAEEVQEMLREGGVPGENGHPVPDSAPVTIERVLTIDPKLISHVIKEFIWKAENQLDGIIETIDDGDGYGDKFRRNILQGLPVSFSTRSLIPQRRNPDGTIDQLGPGRYVTSDRVFVPAHKEAYIDKSIPIKEVCKKSHFEQVMESYSQFVFQRSDKINRIMDGMDPVMESATMSKNGLMSVRTEDGIVGIYPEMKYRREMADIMKTLK